MKTNLKLAGALLIVLLVVISCTKPAGRSEVIWYDKPAERWGEAFPVGNGRLAAMCFGGIGTETFQINEESLWAGSQINPVAENYYNNLKKIQEMVFAGDYAKAHDFGVDSMTIMPTSFRSFEPFADLVIDFGDQGTVSGYKRELDLSSGICRISYTAGGTDIVRESFISAVDDVLAIRIHSTGKEGINCTIRMQRHKDALVTALNGGVVKIDGQIVDIEAPDAYDDNSGGSGPGGEHMRFAGRLAAKAPGGSIQPGDGILIVEKANEIVLIFTAATDYNLAILNFDRSLDPGQKADEILGRANKKSWNQLRDAHVKEHSAMFNRVSLDLGTSPNDTLPLNKRLEAFQAGQNDNDLVAKYFQFGRYLLMGSSRRPATLPANLQGKWSKEVWAPWEADYHLNVNLQMNYWSADVTNLSETVEPLTDWFEQIAEISKPFAKEMYGASGWFSCLANNPFGRVTPSASTPMSQFINGVLDPLAGAWMVMNFWDHYEYSGDEVFLKERLFPLLKGASEFILDVLVKGPDGLLHFVPSASPETAFVDPVTGRSIRITATSTYHLSVIRAVFAATVRASEILGVSDQVCDRIAAARKLLPAFPVDENGRLMEWRIKAKETEPGHRHLSHLLCVHPFADITSDTPDLFNAARKSLDWRIENGQGKGGGWSGAHSSLMHTWFLDGEKAFAGVQALLNSKRGTLLNAGNIFQIDANFGATSAIAEMLIQSHMKDKEGNYIIHLLPAIPSAWPSGSIKGLRTRGGYEVDMEWKDGEIVAALIKASRGGNFNVRYKDKTLALTLKAGEKHRMANL
jgi:alpha-L-fucosidase 2